MMGRSVYLDNAATTPVDPIVVKAMLPYFSEKYGNASSQHLVGQEARRAVEESRRVIAKSIGALADEIIFTSGGTEANNLALKGLFFANSDAGKKHIIITKIEHDCVLNACKWLEGFGARITYLDVDKDGFVNPKDVADAICEDTLVVSVIHGNNEIGVIQNIEEIGVICRSREVYFHTDACQSYTKVPINVKKQNLDLVTLNAHKIHGPKGVGALFVRKGVEIVPLLHGGGHENGLRSGTENVSGIVGFAKAVKIAREKDVKMISEVRDKLIDGILKIDGTKLNGPAGAERLCNNINVSFGNIEGEAIGGYLDAYGISSSTGSACSSHSLKTSHVLKAIGLSDLESNTSLRLSLNKFNNKEDVDYVLEILNKVVEKLRKISPIK
jgi:cysteine desulfurase